MEGEQTTTGADGSLNWREVFEAACHAADKAEDEPSTVAEPYKAKYAARDILVSWQEDSSLQGV